MNGIMLKVSHVCKQYKLGQIGGTTLRDEIQRWKAKRRHQEDPTRIIGETGYESGETFVALDDISFVVKKGERIGIIGHNGAGKSTLLKLISQITAPTHGDIWLNGRVASMLEVGTGFHGELTGRENIYMNGAILGMKKREIDEKIEDIIEFSECRQFIDTPVKRYSSGMYVKLAFSVAAHLDAEIMIMDEVLAVGDMAFQKKCLEKMRDVSKTDGRTILYVSHNMNTIRQLCDRCIVLDHGKIVFDGNVEEAIGVYFGNKEQTEKVMNLREIPREVELKDHPVTMTEIEISGNNTSKYSLEPELNFCLKCISTKEFSNAFLRVIIRSLDGTPVTMSNTNSGFQILPEKEMKLLFSMKLSNLVPGKYLISPVIYEVNQFGNNVNLDVVRDVYSFEIENPSGFNNNMSWLPRFWGYMFNPPIKIIEEVAPL